MKIYVVSFLLIGFVGVFLCSCSSEGDRKPICGNAALEAGEQCDSDDLGGQTCLTAAGKKEGQLQCTTGCFLDVSDCHTCGNGTIDGPEQCDDGLLNGNYEKCRTDCAGVGAHCGDGTIDKPNETCDDGPENGNQGKCKTDCSGVSPFCGDGIKNESDECDGDDLDGHACESFGYWGGELACDLECAFDSAQCLGGHLWSKRSGGTGYDNGTSIAVDSTGNVLATGYFWNTANFGSGDLTSAGGSDIFMAKYDANGIPSWSRRFGGSSNDGSTSIAIDSVGNILVTGSFEVALDMGGGPLTSAGGTDIFVAKFDPSGNSIWSKRFGGTLYDYGYSIARDSADNILVSGVFKGTVNFGGGDLVCAGGYDIVVAKFDSSGAHLWSKRFGGVGDDHGTSIVLDHQDNNVLTGYFESTVNFGGADLVCAAGRDAFVAKFGSSGNHLWSKGFGIAYGDKVFVDLADNVLVTGSFFGNVNFGGGELTNVGAYDIFVAKYDSSGTHLWSKGFGGASEDRGTSISADSDGNALLTGYFKNTVNIGGGELTSAGQNDLFIAKFDPTGNHLWSRRFGGATNDSGQSIVADSSGNILVTGFFDGTIDFGGGGMTTAGNYDIFIAKFKK